MKTKQFYSLISNFLSGVVSVADIGGILYQPDVVITPMDIDILALQSDWTDNIAVVAISHRFIRLSVR